MINQVTSSSIRKPPAFSDCDNNCISVSSTWNAKRNDKTREFSTQTDDRLYEFNDMETQSGKGTFHLLGDVTSKLAGQSLADVISSMTKKYSMSDICRFIEEGFAKIDDETCKNPDTRVDKDSFVELLLCRHDIGTQTIESERLNDPSSGNHGNDIEQFLLNKLKDIENALVLNENSKAFDNYTFTPIDSSGYGSISEDIRYWKMLSVDLEKAKVTYPDWSSAKHSRGKISKVIITRTKERVYDIDYDDGSRLKGVKEEHIRVLEDTRLINERKNKGRINSNRFVEGVRVHTRVTYKSGDVKYLPGRIITSSKGGSYEIEVDGGKILKGVTAEDLMIGIDEGQTIEALKPNKIELQAMDISWNATGSSLATCYGRHDIIGWCNYPGAIVIWNIFNSIGSNGNKQSNEPDFILDHSICLTSCKYHPEYPSIIAAGSFNGEIIVYDLNTPEEPVAISPITEYTHKEPITDLSWIYDTVTKIWLLVSISADGRILFWDYRGNSLAYPVKGSYLSTSKGNSSSTGRSGRQYPLTHGGTSVVFTSTITNGKQQTNHNVNQWTIIGQEGGTIIRYPTSKFFENGYFNKDSFKSLPSYEDLFVAIRRSGETFVHDSHVGAVNALTSSSIYRNVFLSGGADGSVKMFYMLEKTPLKQWDPVPAPGTSGVSNTFAPITDVKFSPIRSCVFAASSSDGLLYLYDLSESLSMPIAVLEAIPPSNYTDGETSANSATTINRSKGLKGSGTRRVGITSIAFNHRQRDLIAACDLTGKIHIWRLNWKLSNRQANDNRIMDMIARNQTSV